MRSDPVIASAMPPTSLMNFSRFNSTSRSLKTRTKISGLLDRNGSCSERLILSITRQEFTRKLPSNLFGQVAANCYAFCSECGSLPSREYVDKAAEEREAARKARAKANGYLRRSYRPIRGNRLGGGGSGRAGHPASRRTLADGETRSGGGMDQMSTDEERAQPQAAARVLME